jgi:hypothetical protein
MKTGGALSVNKDTFSFLKTFYVKEIITTNIAVHGTS